MWPASCVIPSRRPSLPITRAEVVPFSAEQARAILRAARGRRNAARWSVALAMGVRQGEALGARWSDVDLDAGVWRVSQGLQRQAYRHGCGAHPCVEGVKPLRCPNRTGGLVFVEPKTARGRRTLALPTQLVADLKAHRQQQVAERLAAGSVWEDGDFVFAQVNGRSLDPRRDFAEWKALLVAAEVRDARLHDARHTAATLLLEQGVDARVVMDILGHSQISLTQNTYQHVMPAVLAAATERVGAVLFAEA